MTSKRPQPDLTLLKKMVAELEIELSYADQIPDLTTSDKHDYFASMAKASGIAAGIVQEATGLITDCYHCMKNADKSQPSEDDVLSLMSKVMPKGSGGAN